ncbi:hermansky-pudlak syndrome 3 protein [Anaeramoeba ignava]|uniref:Hermansky-pudlak syndrome 3 protein n=1 Tax=Anaeramoeba ignava TaxID=1746090 RepID=A0A9Q0LJ85_ANAIG|nr:hermansky-pudlak syndrome 3 protein [Anaeramoeba ignava]
MIPLDIFDHQHNLESQNEPKTICTSPFSNLVVVGTERNTIQINLVENKNSTIICTFITFGKIIALKLVYNLIISLEKERKTNYVRIYYGWHKLVEQKQTFYSDKILKPQKVEKKQLKEKHKEYEKLLICYTIPSSPTKEIISVCDFSGKLGFCQGNDIIIYKLFTNTAIATKLYSIRTGLNVQHLSISGKYIAYATDFIAKIIYVTFHKQIKTKYEVEKNAIEHFSPISTQNTYELKFDSENLVSDMIPDNWIQSDTSKEIPAYIRYGPLRDDSNFVIPENHCMNYENIQAFPFKQAHQEHPKTPRDAMYSGHKYKKLMSKLSSQSTFKVSADEQKKQLEIPTVYLLFQQRFPETKKQSVNNILLMNDYSATIFPDALANETQKKWEFPKQNEEFLVIQESTNQEFIHQKYLLETEQSRKLKCLICSGTDGYLYDISNPSLVCKFKFQNQALFACASNSFLFVMEANSLEILTIPPSKFNSKTDSKPKQVGLKHFFVDLSRSTSQNSLSSNQSSDSFISINVDDIKNDTNDQIISVTKKPQKNIDSNQKIKITQNHIWNIYVLHRTEIAQIYSEVHSILSQNELDQLKYSEILTANHFLLSGYYYELVEIAKMDSILGNLNLNENENENLDENQNENLEKNENEKSNLNIQINLIEDENQESKNNKNTKTTENLYVQGKYKDQIEKFNHLFQQSAGILGKIMLELKDYEICAQLFSISDIYFKDVFELFIAKKVPQEYFTVYLNVALFRFDMIDATRTINDLSDGEEDNIQEVIEKPGNLSNMILELYSELSPDMLPSIVLGSCLDDYDQSVAIDLLEKTFHKIQDANGYCNSENLIARGLLLLGNERVLDAIQLFESVPTSLFVEFCLENPALLYTDRNIFRNKIDEFAEIEDHEKNNENNNESQSESEQSVVSKEDVFEDSFIPQENAVPSLGSIMRKVMPHALVDVLVAIPDMVSIETALSLLSEDPIILGLKKPTTIHAIETKQLVQDYLENLLLRIVKVEKNNCLDPKNPIYDLIISYESLVQKSEFDVLIARLVSMYIQNILDSLNSTNFLSAKELVLNENDMKRKHAFLLFGERDSWIKKLEKFLLDQQNSKNEKTEKKLAENVLKLETILCKLPISKPNAEKTLQLVQNLGNFFPRICIEMICLPFAGKFKESIDLILEQKPWILFGYSEKSCENQFENWKVVLDQTFLKIDKIQKEIQKEVQQDVFLQKKNLLEILKKQLELIFSKILSVYNFHTILKLVPSNGNPLFFLPLIERSFFFQNSEKIVEEIIKESLFCHDF